MTLVVRKRSGELEAIDVTKAERALVWASEGLSIDYTEIFNKDSISEFFYDEIPTDKIQQLLANKAETKISENWDWSYFAARLLLQKVLKEAHGNAPYVDEKTYYIHIKDYLYRVEKEGVKKLQHQRILTHFDLEKLNDAIRPKNDLHFECMGITTLADRYLLRNTNDHIIEAPQHFLMRVAMGLALAEEAGEVATNFAIELYNEYTELNILSSTPTLFNSATLHPQLSSCFISRIKEDSLDGIFDTAREIAQCSKFSGGTATSVTPLRASGSHIKSTGGKAGGVVPYSKLFEETVRGFDQGGKRPGVIALYLEVWHKDIFDFLESANPSGDERLSVRDIQLATWISDLFMERVIANEDWTLFSPSDCPDLHELHNEEFVKAYTAYEQNPLIPKTTVKAKKVWSTILKCLWNYKGKGWPCFKDTINRRSMTRDYGVVHSSNLCVAGDTLLTFKQYEQDKSPSESRIKDLVNKEILIWNGEQYSQVTVKKTSDNSTLNLVVITIDDGELKQDRVLRCTDYHKWYLIDGTELRTTDLIEGMELEFYTHPVTGKTVTQQVCCIYLDCGDKETYCFTEPLRNRGLFNGILTGNCTEITLRQSEDRTSVCNLGSVNLAKANTKEKLERAVRIAVRATDNAITEGFVPTSHGKAFNDEDRPLGVGVMGYTELIAKLGFEYNSYEHAVVADKLFEFILFIAIDESSKLGELKGNFPKFNESRWAKGELPQDTGYNEALENLLKDVIVEHEFLDSIYVSKTDWENLRCSFSVHMRNSTLLAIAPTATISNIAGVPSCTELPQDTIYQKTNLSGEFTVVSSLYRKFNHIDPKLVNDAKSAGSYFAIVAAAARQKWIDQAQSNNVWVSLGITAKELSNIYILGWQLGVKTFYYLKAEASESKVETVEETKQEEIISEEVELEQPKFCSIENPDCEACQ